MPRRSSPRHSRRLDWMVHQLMVRDPLGKTLTDVEAAIKNFQPSATITLPDGDLAVVKQWDEPSCKRLDDLVAQRDEIISELKEKYQVGEIWIPSHESFELWFGKRSPPLIRIGANWAMPGTITSWPAGVVTRWAPEGSDLPVMDERLGKGPGSTIDGGPPRLTLIVDLQEVTKWHQADMAEMFKGELRKRLNNPPEGFRRPAGPRCPPVFSVRRDGPSFVAILNLSWANGRDYARLSALLTRAVQQGLTEWRETTAEPPRGPLAFLRTIRADTFDRDLTRYDLYDRDGLSYRDIARREVRSGGPRDESGVRASVTQIFTAIHSESPVAKRRRLDRPAAGAAPFYCANHSNGDCPKNCPDLERWYLVVNRTLPSVSSGSLKGQTSRDDIRDDTPDPL